MNYEPGDTIRALVAFTVDVDGDLCWPSGYLVRVDHVFTGLHVATPATLVELGVEPLPDEPATDARPDRAEMEAAFDAGNAFANEGSRLGMDFERWYDRTYPPPSPWIKGALYRGVGPLSGPCIHRYDPDGEVRRPWVCLGQMYGSRFPEAPDDAELIWAPRD